MAPYLFLLFFPFLALYAGDFSSVAELGPSLSAGLQTSSLNGGMGGEIVLRAQKSKGFFRFQNAAEIGLNSGTAYLGDSTSSALMLSGNYDIGAYIYPFGESKLNPFFGGNGIIGWAQLRLSSAPTGVDAITDGLFFGYELSAGCDMNLGSRVYRLRTSYWSTSGTLGGQSSFDLASFRFLVGIVF